MGINVEIGTGKGVRAWYKEWVYLIVKTLIVHHFHILVFQQVLLWIGHLNFKLISFLRYDCYCSFHIQAKELEVLTHAKVNIKIENRWPGGKTYEYHSALPGRDDVIEPRPDMPSPPTTSHAVVALSQATANVETPQTRRRVVPPTDTNKCQVCKMGDNDAADDDTDTGFWWLKCSTKRGKRDKRFKCNYRVHQKCVGLCCSTKKMLKSIPFLCPACRK